MAKKILITHQKGGVGKSTLTFNLANNLNEHSKVAILDMDVQGSLSQIARVSQNLFITNDQRILSTDKEYDFIFIDTPPYLTNHLKELIKLSDAILIPTKAGVLDLLAIDATVSIVKELNCQHKAIIVLNMIKPKTTITKDILDNLIPYDIQVAKTKISDLVAFTRSPIISGYLDNIKAQKQIDSLTKELLTSLI